MIGWLFILCIFLFWPKAWEDGGGRTTAEEEAASPRLSTARWKMRVNAFNALLAVVSTTQLQTKSDKFALNLVFKKLVKFSPHLIREDESYEFPVELEKALHKRRHFSAIRRAGRETERKSENGRDLAATQFFDGTISSNSGSLAAEVSAYDLLPSDSSQSLDAPLPDANHPATGAAVDAFELEMDAVNSHPIMFPLMEFIRDLFASGVCRKPEVSVGSTAQWARSTKNPDVSTGPLARPFARSLAPLTSLTPSLVGQ